MDPKDKTSIEDLARRLREQIHQTSRTQKSKGRKGGEGAPRDSGIAEEPAQPEAYGDGAKENRHVRAACRRFGIRYEPIPTRAQELNEAEKMAHHTWNSARAVLSAAGLKSGYMLPFAGEDEVPMASSLVTI